MRSGRLFFLFIPFALLTSRSLIAQNQPLCGVTCEPDSSSGSYAPTYTVRAITKNARFGIAMNSFSMATAGENGAPGTDGNFNGTLTFAGMGQNSWDQYSFDVKTDVNSYTQEQAAKTMRTDPANPGLLVETPGFTPENNPFINYVEYGLNQSMTVETQIIELGNSLYAISGRLTLAQMHQRTTLPAQTPIREALMIRQAPICLTA